MVKKVTVPLHLLEDILRLLEYVDRLDDLHPYEYGRKHWIAFDTAFWELKMKIQQLHLTEAYVLTVDDVTDDEMRELKEWIDAGNGIYDNPYLLCDESGCPMDFINGCRMGLEMAMNPSDFIECRPDADDDGAGDEGELPF